MQHKRNESKTLVYKISNNTYDLYFFYKMAMDILSESLQIYTNIKWNQWCN